MSVQYWSGGHDEQPSARHWAVHSHTTSCRETKLQTYVVLFPDQRKRVVWELAYTKVVLLIALLQDYAAMQLVVIRTYIRGAAQIGDRVDCVKRERIHEAYMHRGW